MMATVASLTQKSPSTYEFTKRKRWQDLLITDLVDSVLFVLSPSCIVLYVATAVHELLGWKDVDLIDLDFIKLVNPADRNAFRNGFEHSKHGSDVEFPLQVRLICNESQTQPSKELLVEIKLYPQKTRENATETKCVFATATPFPSRNTAALNTLLDLKAENRRLQRKVMDYKSRVPPGSSTSTQSTSSSQANPMYATSSLHPASSVLSTPGITCQKFSEPSNSFDQEGLASGSNFSFDFAETLYGSNINSDEGGKKKKLKKAQNVEQYVCITCGRTDSPEWRKGPLGPKTLCNACGLRWAKQMRKADDPLAPHSSDCMQ